MLKSGSHLPKKNVLFALKMMKNAYFISKAPFVLKIFKFLSWLFGHVEKKKRFDVTSWIANNYNALFAQYLTK